MQTLEDRAAPAEELATEERGAGLDWRRVALSAAGMWLATRVVLVAFTYFAFLFNVQGYDPDFMGKGPSYQPQDLFESWNRWDTAWYLTISEHGYAGDPARTAFFPLYPLLIQGLTFLLGDAMRFAAALTISNLAALAAFVAIALLAASEFGETAAPHAVRALFAYPLAYFTAAAYPDGLFLALATFSLLFARRSMWPATALCAFLAGLTRPTCLVLILPLAWEYARQHGWLSKKGLRTLRVRTLLGGAGVVLAVPAALLLFAAHIWDVLGDPFVFMGVQSEVWKHEFVPVWDIPALAVRAVTGVNFWSFLEARILVDLLPLIGMCILAAFASRRLPVSLTLYSVGTILLTVAAPIPSYFHPFGSVGRYLLAASPLFIYLGVAAARRPWLDMLLLGGGLMLQAVLLGFYLMGGWII